MMQMMGILLMLVGAVLTFLIGGSVKKSLKRMDSEEEGENEDFADLITMSAMVFKIIGFGLVIIGAILFFLSAQ